MNILVTGGAGFIGSHFVLRHVQAFPKDRIVVLDKLTYAADKHFLDSVIKEITFVEGDIVDTKLVKELATKNSIDTIVDFAAETHVDRSISDPFPFIHTNVLGVASLLEACKENAAIRFLHVSTDEVYGDLQDDDAPKSIDDPLLPSSPYAASKASGDLLIQAAVRTYGIKAAISRCTNNFGPHQANEKFIPTVIRCALADKEIPIYAEGKNKRDWLYVSDHCDALEMILSTSKAFDACNIFNVSADSEKQNIEVAKVILKILQKPESLLSFVQDRPGHDWRYALDSSDTRKLGWKPNVSFEEGIEKTVSWYKKRLVG